MNSVNHSILLIDDDEQLSDILSVSLESDGFEIQACFGPESALEQLRRRAFSVALLDLRLGEHNGLELLPKIREIAPALPVLVITAHGDVDSAVDAFMLGAAGYVRKPFREGDLKAQIQRALENAQPAPTAAPTESRSASGAAQDVRSIVRSRDSLMDPLLGRIATAAQVSSNVVITGESGTGKELVARSLHQCGPRRSGPFVAFNCAALPENLLESELFGYVRGAFTDARENKPGLFVRANGGTLFLDEIGDAPLSIQAKLLRVLQEREVLPLGGSVPVKINVRVVAATHKSLQDEVAQGRFRQDLFYRLHVIPIHIPPLRERRRDIYFLASLFAAKMVEELGLQFEGFTPGAKDALESYSWPGNVRELQNRIEHALVLNNQGWITAEGLFPEEGETRSSTGTTEDLVPSSELPTYCEAKNSFERNYLERVLGAAKGNIAKAARLASKSRTEVYSLIRKHRLDTTRFRDTEIS